MPKTCENWLGFANSCIYYACQTCEIYQLLPYLVNFKAPRKHSRSSYNNVSPGSFKIHQDIT